MNSSVMNECPEVIAEFLFYMETIKNLSPRTVDGYFIDLRTFFRFIKRRRNLCSADIPFDEIKIDDVDLQLVKSVNTLDVYEYLHYAFKERENNSSTRSRKVSSLRSYFRYMTTKAHKLDYDPVKDIEVPSIKKSLPKFLTLDESRKLLEVAAEGDFSERNYCIITLFLNCGMRLSELVGIDLSDLGEERIRITGKGNKERLVYINDACKRALSAYIRERNSRTYPNKEKGALFLSRNGERLSARRVEQIVDDCLSRAGLSDRGFSAHKLRHTAATLMYRHGNVDMLALKEILGHEHVSTTEIYTHISDEKLKQAAYASPLSSARPPKNKKIREDKETENDDDA